jgi:hypothetical protein
MSHNLLLQISIFPLAYKKCIVFFTIMHHQRVTESAFRKKLGTILMNIIKDGCASNSPVIRVVPAQAAAR